MTNATMDPSLLPIPAKQVVSFCSDLDTSFVNDVGAGLRKTIQISLILLGVGLLLIIAISCLLERYRYNALLAGVENNKQLIFNTGHPSEKNACPPVDGFPSTPALMAVLAFNQQPLAFSLFDKLLRKAPKFRSSATKRTRAFWFLSYVTYPPALLLLLGKQVSTLHQWVSR